MLRNFLELAASWNARRGRQAMTMHDLAALQTT
jgi:hypothetical protein